MKKMLCSAVCACFLVLGCKDEKIAISDGNNNTGELATKIENIDVASYEGLEDIISNNVHIESDTKPIMLIFGVNNCKYCEVLKDDMRHNEALHALVKDNFKVYYVNTSYSKNHAIAYLNKNMDTDSLARHYKANKTPTIVWLEPDGTEIVNLSGYDANYFHAMLQFVKDKGYGDEKSSDARMNAFIQQYKQGKFHI